MATDTARDSWPGTRIAGNTRTNVKGLWFFAVLWNVVSAPMLVFVPPELERQPLAALGFLFPVVGAGLIVWAAVTTARWRRFGDTWLETASGPAQPGSSWRATIHARLPHDGQAGDVVRVKLTCLRRTISRHGDDRDEREHILWREETELIWTRIAFGAGGASIPVQFDIPADALETTAVGKGEGIFWALTAEAALRGVNLKEDFDVPVRRSGAGGLGGSKDPQPRTKDPQPRTTVITIDDLAGSGISVEPSPEGMRFRFAPARNASFAAGLTAFTGVWTGAVWVQWSLGFPWIFPILTGLIDLLLLYVVIDLWLGTTVVVAGHDALRVRHALLGMGGTRVIAAAEVAAIELHINMQTQGRHGTPYYQVRARLTSGRKASLGSGIRNKRHAEWLAAQMRSTIG